MNKLRKQLGFIKILAGLCFMMAWCEGGLAKEYPSPLVVKLKIEKGVFTPSEIEVSENQRLELEIENLGPGAEEFESKSLKKEKLIPVGKSVKIVLGVLKKGTYDFFGEFHPETAKGKIIVK